ncbi:S8 family peptidase [Halobacillus yeomjeoni]|uniref:S8 family serine peptidase n=1 Tax=Halobacillus yeomjeoni TaxID=311194 RepID=A0A931HWJ6_9BACI|nr:S8 family serine peptidase [Halobacillus yeomjeoni]MBH0230723.1 S8 family serine peptidase [Halobacillus yeomjeoni]
MKNFPLHLLLSVLFLVTWFPISVGAEGTMDTEEADRYIIGFEQSIDLNVLEKTEYTLHHEYEGIQAISASLDRTAVHTLQNDPRIAWIEEDQKVTADRQVRNWGFSSVGADTTKKLKVNGSGVKVAVIDTGINRDHPDLKVAGGKNFVDDVNSYEDDNGHGSHVAGVINAQDNGLGTLGVAPAASMYAVKALDSDGIGNEADVIAGIDWAIQNGMDIINLSLTSPQSSTGLEKIIKKARDQGIFVIAASGNDKSGNGQLTKDVMYPARYDSVIGVGAIDEDETIAEYSYQGESLDFVAPGTQIYSTYMDTEEGNYAHMSGTSMAAPYVSGIIALYKSQFPDLTYLEITNLLNKHVKDLGVKGKDKTYGEGLIQAPISLFIDLKASDWFTPFVNELSQSQMIKGYPDYTFRPQGDITRQEVITLIGRALELNGEKRDTMYTDVTKYHYGSGYIASATSREIVTGYPDQTFKPEANITRADVAVMVYRAFDIPASNERVFEDVDPDKYYYEAIHSLANEDIITGYSETEFKPLKPITRAEFSSILAKTLNGSLR